MPNNRRLRLILLPALGVFACATLAQVETPIPSATVPPASATAVLLPSSTVTATQIPTPLVPEFGHIFTIVLENKEFGTVVNNRQMPYFNELAKSYTLLTQHYAVTHPSLPNYLAMIGGDTFGVKSNCTDCIFDAPTLPDLIEASGRTWKTYQEDMPSPCFTGSDYGKYAMKHNPFVYFTPIRSDSSRCERSVVPFTQLLTDVTAGALPDYGFIKPNLCNDTHDCELAVGDAWLKELMVWLLPALETDGEPYLVIVTWEEGQGNHSCCGLPKEAGGRVATVLISPKAKPGFQDATPYTHYSLLKTISESWHLSYLGHAGDPENVLITLPWQ